MSLFTPHNNFLLSLLSSFDALVITVVGTYCRQKGRNIGKLD